MSIDLKDIESRIVSAIYRDNRMSHELERHDAYSALAEIIAEVETLRAAVAEERAAIVSYLRENDRTWQTPAWKLADAIERGEHRRKETHE